MNNYTINYDYDGGSVSEDNPETYTVKDEITLHNPSKEGYTFLGWTGTDVTEPTIEVTIPRGTTGDLWCKAVFTDQRYTVTFEYNENTYNGIVEVVIFNRETGEREYKEINEDLVVTDVVPNTQIIINRMESGYIKGYMYTIQTKEYIYEISYFIAPKYYLECEMYNDEKIEGYSYSYIYNQECYETKEEGVYKLVINKRQYGIVYG